MQSKRTFLGAGIDLDSDDLVIGRGDGRYRMAINASVSKAENSDAGSLENILGNKMKSSNISNGRNKYVVLGVVADPENDRILWMSYGQDTEGIFGYNLQTEEAFRVVEFSTRLRVLNFSTDYLITGMDVIDGVLYWTDDLNNPSKIDIDRFIGSGNYFLPNNQGEIQTDISRGALSEITSKENESGVFAASIDPRYYADGEPLANFEPGNFETVYSTILTRNILAAAKPAPRFAPRWVSVPSVEPSNDDFLSERMPSFSTRYTYTDGEISATSPWTAPAFQPKRLIDSSGDSLLKRDPVSFESMVNSIGAVDVIFDVGGREVRSIDLLVTEGRGNPIRIVSTIDKDALGLDSSSVYSTVEHEVRYDNNKTYATLPEDEATRPFDDLPRRAKAQAVVGNRIFYGNIETSYPFKKINETGEDLVADFVLGYNSIPRDPNSNNSSCTVKTGSSYEAGIVYLDKFGIAGEVRTSVTGALTIPFNNPDDPGEATHVNRNIFELTLNSPAPYWAEAFQPFFKYPSEEWFNVFPKGVAKDATDEKGIFLQLDSGDRNKVQADTRLVLKGTAKGIEKKKRTFRIEAYGAEDAGSVEGDIITQFNYPFEYVQEQTKNGFGVMETEMVTQTIVASAPGSNNRAFTVDRFPSAYENFSINRVFTVDSSGAEQNIDLTTGYVISSSDEKTIHLLVGLNEGEAVSIEYQYDAVPLDASVRGDFFIRVVPDDPSDLNQFQAELDAQTIWETIPTELSLDETLFYSWGQVFRCENGAHTGVDTQVLNPGSQRQTLYQEGDQIPEGKTIGDVKDPITIPLSWFNCWSYPNGIEETHVRGAFGGRRFEPGIEAGFANSSSLDINRSSSIIHSSEYSSETNRNGLNEFNRTFDIELQLDRKFGSIQHLENLDGDLLVHQEDKVTLIPINEDIIQSADGQSLRTSSNQVYGNPQEFSGEYGISKNPESFHRYGHNLYWADKNRGALLSMVGDRIEEVSRNGVETLVRSQISEAEIIVGIHDDYNEQANWCFRNRPYIDFNQNRSSFTISVAGCFDPQGSCNLVGGPLGDRTFDLPTQLIYVDVRDIFEGIERNDLAYVDADYTEPFKGNNKWHLLIEPAVGLPSDDDYVPPNNRSVQINDYGLIVSVEENCQENQPPDVPRIIFSMSRETFSSREDACANGIIDGYAYHDNAENNDMPQTGDRIYETDQDAVPLNTTGYKVISVGREKFVMYLRNGRISTQPGGIGPGIEDCDVIALGRRSALGSHPIAIAKGTLPASRNIQICEVSFAESIHWFAGNAALPEVGNEIHEHDFDNTGVIHNWTSSEEIDPGQIVRHQDKWWISQSLNTNEEPSSTNTNWTEHDGTVYILFTNGYFVQIDINNRVIDTGFCSQELCFNSPLEYLTQSDTAYRDFTYEGIYSTYSVTTLGNQSEVVVEAQPIRNGFIEFFYVGQNRYPAEGTFKVNAKEATGNPYYSQAVDNNNPVNVGGNYGATPLFIEAEETITLPKPNELDGVPSWNSASEYLSGDEVDINIGQHSYRFRAVNGNMNSQPTASNADWMDVSTDYQKEEQAGNDFRLTITRLCYRGIFEPFDAEFVRVTATAILEADIPTVCNPGGSAVATDTVYYMPGQSKYYDDENFEVPWSRGEGFFGINTIDPSEDETGSVIAYVAYINADGTVRGGSAVSCSFPYEIELGFVDGTTDRQRQDACDLFDAGTKVTVYADRRFDDFSSIELDHINFLRMRNEAGEIVNALDGSYTNGVVVRSSVGGTLTDNTDSCLNPIATLTIEDSGNGGVTTFTEPSSGMYTDAIGRPFTITAYLRRDADKAFASGGEPTYTVKDENGDDIVGLINIPGDSYTYTDTFTLGTTHTRTVEFNYTTEDAVTSYYAALTHRIDVEDQDGNSVTTGFEITTTPDSGFIDNLVNGAAYEISKTLAFDEPTEITLLAINGEAIPVVNGVPETLTHTINQTTHPISNAPVEEEARFLVRISTTPVVRKTARLTVRSFIQNAHLLKDGTPEDMSSVSGTVILEAVGEVGDSYDLSDMIAVDDDSFFLDLTSGPENKTAELKGVFSEDDPDLITKVVSFAGLAKHYTFKAFLGPTADIACGSSLSFPKYFNKPKEEFYDPDLKMYFTSVGTELFPYAQYVRIDATRYRYWNGTSFAPAENCLEGPLYSLLEGIMYHASDPGAACGIGVTPELSMNYNCSGRYWRGRIGHNPALTVSGISESYSVGLGVGSDYSLNFNPNTGEFTAPEEGLYDFSVSVDWNSVRVYGNSGAHNHSFEIGLEIDGDTPKGSSASSFPGIEFSRMIGVVKVGAGGGVDIPRTTNSSLFPKSGSTFVWLSKGQTVRPRMIRTSSNLGFGLSDQIGFQFSANMEITITSAPAAVVRDFEPIDNFYVASDLSYFTPVNLHGVVEARTTAFESTGQKHKDGFYSDGINFVEIRDGELTTGRQDVPVCGVTVVTSVPETYTLQPEDASEPDVNPYVWDLQEALNGSPIDALRTRCFTIVNMDEANSLTLSVDVTSELVVPAGETRYVCAGSAPLLSSGTSNYTITQGSFCEISEDCDTSNPPTEGSVSITEEGVQETQLPAPDGFSGSYDPTPSTSVEVKDVAEAGDMMSSNSLVVTPTGAIVTVASTTTPGITGNTADVMSSTATVTNSKGEEQTFALEPGENNSMIGQVTLPSGSYIVSTMASIITSGDDPVPATITTEITTEPPYGSDPYGVRKSKDTTL